MSVPCSREDEEAQPLVISNKRPLCSKCNTALAIHNSGGYGGHALCAECLVFTMERKFKTNLRMKINLMRGADLVVALSCGASSVAMVDLLNKALNEGKKKMKFVVNVVHIDDSSIWERHFGGDHEEFKAEIAACKQHIKEAYGFEVTTVPIDPQVASMLDFCTGKASEKQELLEHVKLKALAGFAKQVGASIVLCGDSSETVAISAIRATVEGRGFEMPSLVSYTRARFDMMFGLPMRDFAVKDIAMFNKLCKLGYVNLPTFTTALGMTEGGLGHLCDQFIVSLQSKFPGTVSNVIRTAEKLVCPPDRISSPAIASAFRTPLHDDEKQEVKDAPAAPSALADEISGDCVVCGAPISSKDVQFVDGDLKLYVIAPEAVRNQTRFTDETKMICYACRAVGIQPEYEALF